MDEIELVTSVIASTTSNGIECCLADALLAEREKLGRLAKRPGNAVVAVQEEAHRPVQPLLRD